jgi:translation elongation factor EF-Tu-like GTPase
MEDAFTVEGRGVFVFGRVSLGDISHGNDICIVDETGSIKRYARVSEVDYGYISKCHIPKSAIEGWNVGLLFTEVTLEEISMGNYIVIKK